MPNTFSMPPDYVRRFVETKRLQRIERNVFALLRAKIERLFHGAPPLGSSGLVVRADAKHIANEPAFAGYRGRVKLILTSPPYLDVVNYARQNWIRCWFLGEGTEDVHDELDDNLTLQGWLDFMARVLDQLEQMLAPDGTIVFVIGDVARSSRSILPIAREFLRRVKHEGRFAYIGCMSDHLQIGTKTTRIWGDTKGQATSVDRIIIFSRQPPVFDNSRLAAELHGNASIKLPMIDPAELSAVAARFGGWSSL